MVTDEERREVAGRLCGLNGNISHVRRVYEAEGLSIFCDDQADYYQICDVVTGYLPAEHMHPCDYEELHARLADLIDPGESGQNPDKNRDTVQIESPAVQKAPECDREALLAIAQSMMVRHSWLSASDAARARRIAARIREACGEVAE